jgi:hypothetical protein
MRLTLTRYPVVIPVEIAKSRPDTSAALLIPGTHPARGSHPNPKANRIRKRSETCRGPGKKMTERAARTTAEGPIKIPVDRRVRTRSVAATPESSGIPREDRLLGLTSRACFDRALASRTVWDELPEPPSNFDPERRLIRQRS